MRKIDKEEPMRNQRRKNQSETQTAWCHDSGGGSMQAPTMEEPSKKVEWPKDSV
jgi:hypothetical protein